LAGAAPADRTPITIATEGEIRGGEKRAAPACTGCSSSRSQPHPDHRRCAACEGCPLPQLALLDEPAHLATAVLVLGAASRTAGGPVWPWVLTGSVAIDIDHLPGYLGVSGFSAYGGRPLSHSRAAVLALALFGAAAGPSLRQPFVGLAGGVTLHPGATGRNRWPLGQLPPPLRRTTRPVAPRSRAPGQRSTAGRGRRAKSY
jgi:hypothetical protein